MPGYKSENDRPQKVKRQPKEKKPQPKPVAKDPPQEDIFIGNDPSPSTDSPQLESSAQINSESPAQIHSEPLAPSQSVEDDIFGVDFSVPTSSPVQPPKEDNVNKLNEIMNNMSLNKNEPVNPGMLNTGAPGMGGPMGPGSGFGGPAPGMFNTGMPGGNFGGPMGGPPMGNPGMMGGPPMGGPGMMGGPPMGGPGQFATAFNGPPGGGFGGNMGGDPFIGPGNQGPSLFGNNSTPNYNPGGGPQAFSDNPVTKKVEKGPKEFSTLFTMANKISDRLNQPQNKVDDYVTSYKNNIENSSGGDFMGRNIVDSQVDDMFGGNDSQPGQVSNSNTQQDMGGAPGDDPFGGISESFGGQPQNNDMSGAPAQTNDMFGGAPATPIDDMFGEQAPNNSAGQPQPTNDGGMDMFGGGQPVNNAPQPAVPSNNVTQPAAPANNGQSNQDELFDIFG